MSKHAEDLSWLEDGEAALSDTPIVSDSGVSAPNYANMTKRELCAALDYNPAKLDRLIRLGLPGRKGASNAAGYRFTLAEVVEWIARHRAIEAGGGDDNSLAAAKRRKALADARRAELENEEREGELIQAEAVLQWIVDNHTRFRTRLESLETEIVGMSSEQQHALRDALHSALIDISEQAATEALKLDREEHAKSNSRPRNWE